MKKRTSKKSEVEKAKVDVFDVMNSKQFCCRHCGEYVTFIHESIQTTRISPACDGVNFVCDECDFEDDISQIYCVFKDGEIMNVEDYYSEYGFYGHNSQSKIIMSLNFLADR